MKAWSRSCRTALACMALAPAASVAVAQAEADPAVQRLIGYGADWTEFLADSGAGSVSAASMLGLSGDAVHQLENVKDVVLALRGLGGKGEKAGLGLSIAPARTSLTPMNLSTYYSGGVPMRLLGALTLGYAQGSTESSGQTLNRKAISLETSIYLRRQDDPVVAYALALENCDVLPNAGVQQSGVPEGVLFEDSQATPAATARARTCRDKAKLRWNASRASLAFGTGRVSTDGAEHSLGRVWALTAMYGFDHISRMRDGHALTLTLRRSNGEPLLQTLSTASPVFVDRSLTALRYTVGSDRFKALAEGSNARERQPTASDAVFKRALGLDVKLQEKLWLSLRVGKKRKIDGSGEETASMLNLSYSPSALLKP